MQEASVHVSVKVKQARQLEPQGCYCTPRFNMLSPMWYNARRPGVSHTNARER